jgi:hypothetical protein
VFTSFETEALQGSALPSTLIPSTSILAIIAGDMAVSVAASELVMTTTTLCAVIVLSADATRVS